MPQSFSRITYPAAIDGINNHYQTSGDLGAPIVMLHTWGDPIVPYWHEPLYRHKIRATGHGALHTNIPVPLRYGHCNFNAAQLLLGFVLLVHQVTGEVLPDAERVLWTDQDREEYRDLAAAHGLLP